MLGRGEGLLKGGKKRIKSMRIMTSKTRSITDKIRMIRRMNVMNRISIHKKKLSKEENVRVVPPEPPPSRSRSRMSIFMRWLMNKTI